MPVYPIDGSITNLPQPKDQSAEEARALVALTVDCISDDELRDTTFRVYLKRLALLLSGENVISDAVTEQHTKYTIQVLRELR